ncbi:MAG: Smr/MutS family protein [Bauldia sp.]|nr:Smr/MutS family protein [Bauldia sp.]
MTSRRRRGHLTPDETELWDRVRRSAEPLRPEDAPPVEGRAVGADVPSAASDVLPGQPAPGAAAKPAARRSPGSPSQIERTMLARLARGSVAIDARVDLHGLTQLAAHARLLRFLRTAQERGHRIVLVITGRGDPHTAVLPGEERRGVLRQAVPNWLRAPEFTPLVSGFGDAHRSHGGPGALYVRVRRSGKARPLEAR